MLGPTRLSCRCELLVGQWRPGLWRPWLWRPGLWRPGLLRPGLLRLSKLRKVACPLALPSALFARSSSRRFSLTRSIARRRPGEFNASSSLPRAVCLAPGGGALPGLYHKPFAAARTGSASSRKERNERKLDEVAMRPRLPPLRRCTYKNPGETSSQLFVKRRSARVPQCAPFRSYSCSFGPRVQYKTSRLCGSSSARSGRLRATGLYTLAAPPLHA